MAMGLYRKTGDVTADRAIMEMERGGEYNQNLGDRDSWACVSKMEKVLGSANLSLRSRGDKFYAVVARGLIYCQIEE